jgi:hypothetical protein
MYRRSDPVRDNPNAFFRWKGTEEQNVSIIGRYVVALFQEKLVFHYFLVGRLFVRAGSMAGMTRIELTWESCPFQTGMT